MKSIDGGFPPRLAKKLIGCIRRYLFVKSLRLEISILVAESEFHGSVIFNAIIRLRRCIKSFLKRIRKLKCITRIQRCFRRYLQHIRCIMNYLNLNRDSGIVVLADSKNVVDSVIRGIVKKYNKTSNDSKLVETIGSRFELTEIPRIRWHCHLISNEIRTTETPTVIDTSIKNQIFQKHSSEFLQQFESIRIECDSVDYNDYSENRVKSSTVEQIDKLNQLILDRQLSHNLHSSKFRGIKLGIKKILEWTTSDTIKRRIQLFRNRGCKQNSSEKKENLWLLNFTQCSFIHYRMKKLFVIHSDDLWLLARIKFHSCRESKNVTLPDEIGDSHIYATFYERFVLTVCAAVKIQSVWRGLRCRKQINTFYVQAVIYKRALILIQRWYRYRTGLYHRFTLLKNINIQCKQIISSKLYLDSRLFYCLLREKSLPILTPTMRIMPEFQGVPSIIIDSRNIAAASFDLFDADSDLLGPFRRLVNGYSEEGEDNFNNTKNNNDSKIKIKYQYSDQNMNDDSTTLKDDECVSFHDIPNCFNFQTGLRFGLPFWASWNTVRYRKIVLNEQIDSTNDYSLQLKNKPELKDIKGVNTTGFRKFRATSICRESSSFIYYDLLTLGVNIKLKELSYCDGMGLVPPRTATVSSENTSVRMIELEFSTVYEARMRCAMLMLASWQGSTWSCVRLMPRDVIINR